jgi:hypothetical protein
MGKNADSGAGKIIHLPAIPAKRPALPAIRRVSTQRIWCLAKLAECVRMLEIQGIL